jgi:hypothetical protein
MVFTAHQRGNIFSFFLIILIIRESSELAGSIPVPWIQLQTTANVKFDISKFRWVEERMQRPATQSTNSNYGSQQTCSRVLFVLHFEAGLNLV